MLTSKGEDVVFIRKGKNGQPDATVTARASVRGLDPEVLIGTVTQQQCKIIASVSPILEANPAQWPGPNGGGLWPRANDFVVVQGKQRQILAAVPIFVDGKPVRLELRAGG
ncbi:hypothetical protein [Gellertiella hungarica]|uniref:Uncharacterized protein n=1 Tax=Gellertiella hungarica TaxID=1572859 RepID=A0A7W6J4P1_9HYPH|nr:hypothetical protein [Gellertiella hungarica]MBB4064736.1 hypothetical protein [Gellertiella hungarica]